jgi:Sec-independent protein translocase protein TatA
MPFVLPLAFISGTEILLAIAIGLLLFGGKLPGVLKDVGRFFFKAKRSLEDLRQESGVDEAIRDIQRESEDIRTNIPDWREASEAVLESDEEE